jgi:hypothetical protein
VLHEAVLLAELHSDIKRTVSGNCTYVGLPDLHSLIPDAQKHHHRVAT